MPSIGSRCHELRITDPDRNWRIVYACVDDCVVILEVFAKTTRQTPDSVIRNCRRRLKQFLEIKRPEDQSEWTDQIQ